MKSNWVCNHEYKLQTELDVTKLTIFTHLGSYSMRHYLSDKIEEFPYPFKVHLYGNVIEGVIRKRHLSNKISKTGVLFRKMK